MLKRYFLTFCNQGLVSVFSFALVISLVRQWEIYDFGIFALVLQVALTLESFQSAFVTAPLSVLAPATTRRAPRLIIESTLWSTGSLLIAVVAVVAIAAAAVLDNSGRTLAVTVTVAAFLTARLLRDYARSYLFSRLLPAKVAVADLVYVGVGSVVVAAVWAWPLEVDLVIVLAGLAAGALIGAWLSLVAAGVPIRVHLRRSLLRRYRGVWNRTARWAVAGVTTTTLHARSHTIVVTAAFGPELFAALAAGEALVAPIRAALHAWGTITRPIMAAAFGRRDLATIDRINRFSMALLAAGFLLFVSVLWLSWDFVNNALYGSKYTDMALIVGLWVLVIGLVSLRSILSITLQSMQAFRELSFATLYGAVVSLGSVVLLVSIAGFEYSLLGLAIGESVVLAVVVRTYRRLRVRQRRDCSKGDNEP